MNSDRDPFHFAFEQREIERLCGNAPTPSSEYYPGNDAFGLAGIFKEYAGLPPAYPLRLAMEHGLRFDDNVTRLERNTPFDTILTPSRHRAEIVARSSGKRTMPVGWAYLHARRLFPKFGLPPIRESNRVGTLVFPFKSTQLTELEFDHARFARQIRSLPSRFQPAWVCIYWSDVLDGIHEIYEDAGLPTVTAGHRLDPLFLHRLHDLCRRFRYAASNEIGTNLFVAVESGCRFFFLEGPEYRRRLLPGKGLSEREGSRYEENRSTFRRLFASPVEEVTPEQRRFVDLHLGKADFTSPRKLRRLLLKGHRCFESLPWWVSRRRLLAPAKGCTFDWRSMTTNHAWHKVETVADRTFRWMGAEDDAWLDLEWPERRLFADALLRCEIPHLVTTRVSLRINGVPLPSPALESVGEHWRLETPVPRIAFEAAPVRGRLRIEFHVDGALRPRDSDPDHPDRRRLGFALERLTLEPLES